MRERDSRERRWPASPTMAEPSSHRPQEEPNRIKVSGVGVDRVDTAELFRWLVDRANEGDQGERSTVGYVNIHVANCATADADVDRYVNELCDVVYCDGRGIVLAARLQGSEVPPRTTATYWLPDLLLLGRERGLRIFVVAGREGVVGRALTAVEAELGPLGPVAHHHGYLDDTATQGVLEHIEAFAPHVVLVGMGTPAQERWVLRHRAAIGAPVVWTVGAAFDHYAGEQSLGPVVFRRLGHDWLGRLWSDPRRLWRRYLWGNLAFFARMVVNGASVGTWRPWGRRAPCP